MDLQFAELPTNKKIYLASDFHLGAPTYEESLHREKKIVQWLESIENDAAGIILVGDLFDFWFEYRHVIPKGFVRFLGKIAQLRGRNIPVIFFTGNHDLWMSDYFQKELGIQLEREPKSYQMGPHKIHIGHGDGLGPGDRKFKFYKKVFLSRIARWGFRWLHPDLGVGLAKLWSGHSRNHPDDVEFQGENEWLIIYSKSVESTQHHDFYIYGHRHIPSKLATDNFTYYNLGEWISKYTFLEIDQNGSSLKTFEN